MKTDVITIYGSGEGIEKALRETEKAAVYCGLDTKQSLRLRLLAEEMTGMLRTIVGEEKYLYWIEGTDKAFTLHLRADVIMDRLLYDELIKTATSGKNDAAKGFMGRVRDIWLRFCEPGAAIPSGEYGFTYLDACGYDPGFVYPADAICHCWSLNAYREQVEAHRDEKPEQWDELERSITANLADEVKVFIRGNSVELEVDKNFQ